MRTIQIKSAYKKYEIFSWEQEQKDLRKSMIGITVLPVTIWLVFYAVPLLILSLKFNALTKNIFWNLLPNIIAASIGAFFIWIAIQAFGRGIRRYILPSYLHQKIQEWRGEIKKQKKELKRLTAVAFLLDERVFNSPFESEDEFAKTVFEQFKDNRKNLGEVIDTLKKSIEEQKQQLNCFEAIMAKRNLVQRIFAVFRPYAYWKKYYQEPEIFPLK